MIGKTTIGTSFGGCVRYQFEGHKNKGEEKKAEVLEAVGVRGESADRMIADFNRGRKLNPELGRAVWHTSISFNPDDAPQLTNEKMLAVAQDYVAGMGLDQTQYVLIRHHDQPHPHVHLIANRVDNRGKTISDSHNYARSQALLQELSIKHGLTPVAERRPGKQRAEQLQGADLSRHQIRQVISQALSQCSTTQQFEQQLKTQGIGYQLRRNEAGKSVGISFSKDGHTFKGSAIDRKYSHDGLLRQIQANLDRVNAQRATQAAKQAPGAVENLQAASRAPVGRKSLESPEKAPELTELERKWQKSYERYSTPLREGNAAIRSQNELVGQVVRYLEQHPSLAAAEQLLQHGSVQQHYYLRADLSKQIQSHQAHHRALGWATEQRQQLSQQAQERKLFGLGGPTDRAKEAQEKLAILDNPPRQLPEKHYQFALQAQLTRPPQPIQIQAAAYLAKEKPLLSLSEYARQMEQIEQQRIRDQAKAQAQKPEKKRGRGLGM